MTNALPLMVLANLGLDGLRTIDQALARLGWEGTRTYDEFRFFALGDLRTRLEGPVGNVRSAHIGVWSTDALDLDEKARLALGREAYSPIRARIAAALAGSPSGDWSGPAGERRAESMESVVESDVWSKDGLQIACFLELFDDANPVTIAVEIYPVAR